MIELTILIAMTTVAISFIASCVILTLMVLGVGTEPKVVDINTVAEKTESVDLVAAFKRGALVNQPWLK